jgi:hypothetical protein
MLTALRVLVALGGDFCVVYYSVLVNFKLVVIRVVRTPELEPGSHMCRVQSPLVYPLLYSYFYAHW